MFVYVSAVFGEMYKFPNTPENISMAVEESCVNASVECYVFA